MPELGGRTRAAAGTHAPAALDDALGRHLFASLQRSGQRAKAEQYVRGLLSVPGRKTLRNIAARFDGAAAQQSVHHFISSSPWEWTPVRHALARHAYRTLAPEAWVIRHTLIPKVGSHSVGVDLQPTPYGSVNAQRAVGSWLVSPRAAVPVDWQLHLSERWMTDPLRRRASVPEDAAVCSTEECVRETVFSVLGIDGGLRLPVVVDIPGLDGASTARFLSSLGLPFLVRVGRATPLRLDRAELPRYGDLERTAGDLAEFLPRLRRRVDPGDGPTTAAAIPVVPPPAEGEGMVLLCEWNAAGRRRLWLTNTTAPSPVPALRLTRLPAAVVRDFTAVSERVGVRDFAGRSFPGWHRHITLASVAHLIAVTTTTELPSGNLTLS
ncbi:transposase [Streptomyces sp. NPDC049555]|uniref:IS701 family transposase n=1 Tax=unclassified Streptomyces TaxID=2593676 RepID=UPI00341FB182